jgi:hypothetical protein
LRIRVLLLLLLACCSMVGWWLYNVHGSDVPYYPGEKMRRRLDLVSESKLCCWWLAAMWWGATLESAWQQSPSQAW